MVAWSQSHQAISLVCPKTMLFLLFFIPLVEARIHLTDPVTWMSKTTLSEKLTPAKQLKYTWSEEWLDNVPVDHFSFANKDSFKLRQDNEIRLIRKYNSSLTQTILSKMVRYYFILVMKESLKDLQRTLLGFMWDIAPELGATVVFAEHRFYGKTQPYRNESYSSTDKLGYLSSEQALADFVLLIDYLKEERIPGASRSPVIALGGSYGGMLAAWMRIKYPHKVVGAIAASAPVFWFFDSHVPEDIYDKNASTSSFLDFTLLICAGYVLDLLSEKDVGRLAWRWTQFRQKDELQTTCSHCDILVFQHASLLTPRCQFTRIQLIKSSIFIIIIREILPLCVRIQLSAKEHSLHLATLWAGHGNPVPKWSCRCVAVAGLMIFSGRIVLLQSKFSKIGFDRSMLREHWASDNYGTIFPSASNIVFSNGFLDPWSGGGWSLKPKINRSLISIILKDGAHHYDLRGSHPQDTDEVKKIRETEKNYIKRWIKQAKAVKNYAT
uniref:Lysosomal Pro-X carboxypeptidase n=1 Tax=Heterorhabditis bacteriophora TaxID=37862 RepID=A0A1I7XBE3_HETBA